MEQINYLVKGLETNFASEGSNVVVDEEMSRKG